MIRIDPTKVLVGGDQTKARNFIGAAKSQLEILKNQMTFQNLTQGIRKLWLNADVYVECRKIFNYQECRIWVRPEDDRFRYAYFFVRICHPGWFPVSVMGTAWRPTLCSEYGQTFDQYYVKVPDLKMDRIIFWEPELASDTTISPGQGIVVVDVDIVSDTVYYADPSMGFEHEEAVLLWAKEYIDKPHYDGVQVESHTLHPGWSTWPKINEIENMRDEWISTGSISSPDYNSYLCSGNSGNEGSEVSVGMDEYFDPIDSGNYYHMMTTIMPDISGTLNPIELEAWRGLWCIEYGGDPEQVYNSRLWPKLSENADHYPSTAIPSSTGVEYKKCFHVRDFTTGTGTYSIDYYARSCSAPGVTEIRSVAEGAYYTGRSEDLKFPTFFCYLSISGSGFSNDGEERWYSDGVYHTEGWLRMSYSFSNTYGLGNNTNLVTPLEVIPFAELCVTSGLLDNGSSCLNDGVTCFDDHEFISVKIENGFEICSNADVVNMLPCSACFIDTYGDPATDFSWALKKSTVIDNNVLYVLNIPDPTSLSTNLLSLSIHVDRSAGSRAAFSINWWGGGWTCGSTGYGGSGYNDFDDVVPLTCSNEFGFIYYILNPEAFWWTDADTGQTEFFDIHTARETNPDEINSYRVLELEDYVSDIAMELRSGLRSYPTTDLDIEDPAGVLSGGLPKYPNAEDGWYSLFAYGYFIYDGFVEK